MARRSRFGWVRGVVLVFLTAIWIVGGCGGKAAEQAVGDGDGDVADSTGGEGSGTSQTGGGGGDGDGDAGGSPSSSGGVSTGSGGATSAGGATTSGGVNMGGAAETGGNAGAGGSGSEPTGLETFGADCSMPGALSCSTSEPRLRLLCDSSGEWVENGTCDGALLCDPSPENRGSCQTPLQYCDGEEPGYIYCEGYKTFECGERATVSTEAGVCSLGCLDGVCQPVDDECPAEGSSSCSSDCTGIVNCDEGPLCSGTISYSSDWPPAARVPSADELCDVEVAGCEAGSPVGLLLGSPEHMRMMVPEDWSALVVPFSAASDTYLDEHCVATHETGCIAHSDLPFGSTVLLFPTRSDAAARNFIIEFAETPLECP